MLVFREDILSAIKFLIKRISLMTGIYIIWAIVLLFNDHNNYMMFFQLGLFIFLASRYAISLNKITYEEKIEVLKIIKWTDLLIIISILFIFGYHFVYRIYNIIYDFEWLEILKLIFAIWSCVALWKNNLAYTIAINNLSLFNDREIVDFEEGEWENFLKSNMIN